MFDFTEFARSIYDKWPPAHERPYLLPALYGGEPTMMYDAMFVLEAPSVPFTEDRWESCYSVEAAIRIHRKVFLVWASQGYCSILFRTFLTTPTDFFERVYVTDVWKDARACEQKVGSSEYKSYWRSKLAIELNSVPTQCVITVGGVAQREVGQLRRAGLIGEGLKIEHIGFPGGRRQGITYESYGKDVAALIEKIQTED
ncbi:MAG: hypothetical protein QOG00_2055 [Pyrinomonadaceae bacterium]|nr:hypothetical protein [Pyrinomonadaceae bacterium]